MAHGRACGRPRRWPDLVLGITDPWVYVSAASGVALALVGVYVARVGRGAHQNRAFGVYAVGFGLVAAVSNLTDYAFGTIPDAAFMATEIAMVVLALVGTAGLVVLVLTYPTRIGPEDRRIVWFASATLAALFAMTVAINVVGWREGLLAEFPASVRVGALLATVTFDLLRDVMMASGVLLALRYRRAAVSAPDMQPRIALMAVAILLYPSAYGMWVAGAEPLAGTALPRLIYGTVLAAIALVFTLWLRNTRLSSGGHLARNVAIVAWVPPLLGLSYRAFDLPLSVSWLMRTLEVLLLAFAILRHQLLGIDVKVRWGISKSTIAGAFIAVFFVASEGAQLLFDARGEWVGLAAAGALVFAIAPLQRAADRLAEKAVRVQEDPAPRVPHRRLDVYRDAVRYALRDGRLSRKEELHLAHLAEELGLGAGAAMEIRHGVEREHAGGAP